MMENVFHNLDNLFVQLGLDNSQQGIDLFIKQHKLRADQHIEAAEFWTPSQAAFISESLSQDSDWSEVVDQLNVLLHQ